MRQRPEKGGDYNLALIELKEGPRMMSRVVGVPPEAVQEEIRAVQAQADTPLMELLDHEAPYEEGAYWFVRCRVHEATKGEREDLVRVRFFEFDGVRSCMVAMPD